MQPNLIAVQRTRKLSSRNVTAQPHGIVSRSQGICAKRNSSGVCNRAVLYPLTWHLA